MQNILAFYGTIGKGGSELAIVTELMDGTYCFRPVS